MTHIKICGLTCAADADLATELGADFLGFVFVPESPRCVTPATVRAIVASPSAKRVGVFRGASAAHINSVADEAQLDYVQIHGQPPRGLTRPVIHAFHVQGALPETTTDATYVLFDTGGGMGRTFDWTLLQRWPRTTPFFLAGGITPENVTDAIRVASPDGIDLSSGIESAPGIKDHHKMRRLFERVKR